MATMSLDLRKFPVEGFLNNFISTDSDSFVHSKYVGGRPNSSLASTKNGVNLALERLTSERDEDAFFGVHIKETIHQFRTLFGKKISK
jgi:hypothetical protein